MAKKKPTEVLDAQTAAVEAILDNAITQLTKITLINKLKEDLAEAEERLLELQPNYDEYMKYKQKERVANLMIEEVSKLPIAKPYLEPGITVTEVEVPDEKGG